MLKREKIIVLKTFPFLESDLILRGLTSSSMKVSFIAKGALKSRHRFGGGVLEPCSFIEVEYKPSRRSLHRLTQAWFFKGLQRFKEGLSPFDYGLVFCKSD